jgi:hypothetical protein
MVGKIIVPEYQLPGYRYTVVPEYQFSRKKISFSRTISPDTGVVPEYQLRGYRYGSRVPAPPDTSVVPEYQPPGYKYFP